METACDTKAIRRKAEVDALDVKQHVDTPDKLS